MCGFVNYKGLFFHHVLIGDWGSYCCTKLITSIFCFAKSKLVEGPSSVYVVQMLGWIRTTTIYKYLTLI